MDPILLLTESKSELRHFGLLGSRCDCASVGRLFSVWCWVILIVHASAFSQCIVKSPFSSTFLFLCVLSKIYVPRTAHTVSGHPKFEKFWVKQNLNKFLCREISPKFLICSLSVF